MFDLTTVAIPDLAGKTILVSGAGRGIGAVVAGLLAKHGAEVYAGVYREADPEWASWLADVKVLKLDVTQQLEVDHALSRIRASSGKLDGLINNAGVILPIGHTTTLHTDSMRAAMEVNVLGVHRLTCAALPLLQSAGGVVINAGTGAATKPMEGWASYCSSKAGARMLTQMFALELADSGVQFFFLGIPPTDTDMQADIRDAGLNPISKIPRADLVACEIPASAMAWLCGAEARKLEEVLLDVREEPFSLMMHTKD